MPTVGRQLAYDLDVGPEASYDPGDRHFTVEVNYTLRLEHRGVEAGEGDNDKRLLALIAFVYAGLFVLDIDQDEDEPTAEELAAYASTTGHFALYPYVREFVQDLTGRLAFPPLTLRVLRLDLPKPSVKAD